MTKPRVGIFLPRLSTYGGAERFARRLSQALAEDGCLVDFVCARKETEPPPGVKCICVARLGLTRFGKLLWYADKAERVRRWRKYDLTISLGKTQRQDVLRFSGGPLEKFWELSKRAYPQGLARAFKMFRRRTVPSNIFIKSLEKKQLENSRVVVAVSHKVRDWLLEAHPWLDPGKIRIIYNKPDLEQFTPAVPGRVSSLRTQLGLCTDANLIGIAGTNFALKGLAPLISALKLMPENTHLAVAGGRRPMKYMKQALSLGLQTRTHFLGKVEDMTEFYRALDLFALPSFYDTCSNAVLEAMACGIRTVSSADNGSSYFLPPDRVVADPSDAANLARVMRQALDEPGPGPFDWPKDVPAGLKPYLNLVREMLDKK